VFRLTGCLYTAVFADAIEAPYLRITTGHYANIGEKDTLIKDREPPKTIPNPAARTYIAHIGECPPPQIYMQGVPSNGTWQIKRTLPKRKFPMKKFPKFF